MLYEVITTMAGKVKRAVFEAFGIVRMDTATGALREGLLYDLIGRIRHEDTRERAISRLVEQSYNFV